MISDWRSGDKNEGTSIVSGDWTTVCLNEVSFEDSERKTSIRPMGRSEPRRIYLPCNLIDDFRFMISRSELNHNRFAIYNLKFTIRRLS